MTTANPPNDPIVSNDPINDTNDTNDTDDTSDTNDTNDTNDAIVVNTTPADVPKDEDLPAPPKKRQRVSKYTEITKADLQDVLERRGDVFIAPLKKPLHILTPTVTLNGDLYNADGDLNDYVTLKLKRTHAEVFGSLETKLLETAKTCKTSWFNNPEIQDEFLEQSLRRFFDAENRLLTVRLDDGLGGAITARKGEKIKAVLHTDGAMFTRTQYGFLWQLTLIKSIEKNEDQYLFDPEEDPSTAGLATNLLACVGQDDPIDEFLQ
jgi:hypothetical protein